MIDLLTLYLGLTVGVQPVEVLAAPQVARVEVLLDGAPAAQLDIGQLDADDPALVDFGAKLAPHRLEVVAFGDGGELGRQSQDVNLAPGAAFAVGTPETRTPILVPSGSRRRGVTAKELDGRLRAAARPVPVLAVDGGDGGDLVVVIAPAAALCLAPFEEPVIARLRYFPEPTPVFPPGAEGAVEPVPPGTAGLRLYFLDPRPAAEAAPTEPDPFLLSPPRTLPGRNLALELVRYRSPFPEASVALAHAVAAAGRHAYGGGRPRAVLLVLGPKPSSGAEGSAGAFSPDRVSAFLDRLGVPLHVWHCGADDGGDGGWVIDRHVHHHRALLAASDRLRHSLDRQRVAWVEGRYLPQEIELVDGPIEGRRP